MAKGRILQRNSRSMAFWDWMWTGSPVALYRLGNEVFATPREFVPHALAVLSEWLRRDGKIECPLHQGHSTFVRARRCMPRRTEDLRTYGRETPGR